ncbi:MAG: HDOD domain protein [Syntrophorhabdus sp. PtaU1.Bin058]|nr:MAG: HDOD domain protein [Syntrophorhabdus sp. PtaU1.Bin058]
MDNDYILNKLKKVDMLPTFPGTVGTVMSLIQDPMSSAADLAKNMDPSMVSEVLRIANTAYFGTKNFRNISSIEHAIAIIGLEHLSSIVIQMPFISMVKGDTAFDREKFMEHSIMCGVLSKAISLSVRLGNPNEVYIGGMMHDIGAIIFYRYFRNEWDRAYSLVRDRGMTWPEAEKEVFSMDHGYIGAVLLELWNIPKGITDCVMFHHCPDKATENRGNATAVNLGNRFSKLINIHDDIPNFDDFLGRYRSFLNLNEELGLQLLPSDEIIFYEKIYAVAKETQHYIYGTVREKE